MARARPRKIAKYGERFKATAVKLSSLPGVLIQDVAAALDIHPFMLSLWRKQVRQGVIVARASKLDVETTAELRRLRELKLPPVSLTLRSPGLPFKRRRLLSASARPRHHGYSGVQLSRGFTLVEMMVVLGVVAILALMTIPTYLEKAVRDQVAEALPLADIAKAPTAAAWALALPLPADNEAAGLPAADKIVNNYASSVTVQDGAIHIMFGNRASNVIKGKLLTLRPAVVEDARVVPVTWVCGNAAAPDKMTVKGTNKTDLPKSFLPMKCRAG